MYARERKHTRGQTHTVGQPHTHTQRIGDIYVYVYTYTRTHARTHIHSTYMQIYSSIQLLSNSMRASIHVSLRKCMYT